MRTRCKSIDASDHCLDHLLTGQALLLSFAASCLAARPAGHAPKPGPAFDPKMFGLVPGLSEVISALASILDGNGQSGNYSPTLRDRQFARHIAIHNSVVYDVVPMTSSAKGHYSKCFGEKWPNWHDFPRSGEIEGADLHGVLAFWAAKSIFSCQRPPGERNAQTGWRRNQSPANYSPHKEQGKIQGKVRTKALPIRT